MTSTVKPVPEGYRTATPYMVIRAAAEAMEFYKRAFGAVERFCMPGPGGSIMHAEMQIGDSIIMLCDEFPEMGSKSPQTLGGTSFSVFLYVEDVDAWFKRAVGAGATGVAEPTGASTGSEMLLVPRSGWTPMNRAVPAPVAVTFHVSSCPAGSLSTAGLIDHVTFGYWAVAGSVTRFWAAPSRTVVVPTVNVVVTRETPRPPLDPR